MYFKDSETTPLIHEKIREYQLPKAGGQSNALLCLFDLDESGEARYADILTQENLHRLSDTAVVLAGNRICCTTLLENPYLRREVLVILFGVCMTVEDP